MNTAPIELFELIIAYTPIEDLFSLCHADRTLFKLVRHEAYKRWKQCAIKYGELFWEDQDLSKIWKESQRNNGPVELDIAYFKLNTNLKTSAEEQMYIMEKMRYHGMIVDEQEKGIIDYCIIMTRYTSNPWGLNWSWCCEEWLEDES